MTDISRRKFLKWTIGGLAASVLACISGPAYALQVEPRWLALEDVTIPLPGLPSTMVGFKLAFISDLHLGGHTKRNVVTRAVDMVLEAGADAILIGGDVISAVAGLPAAAEELARLEASHGVFACLGNHDHWTAPERVAETLTGAGVGVLRNRAISLHEGLWLAGVDDVWEEQDDLDAALGGIPEGAPTVLLAHEPEFADRAAEDGRVALQLSGHTHGGQVRLPLIGPPVLPYLGERYPAGLYHVGEMALYVTRGVGLIAPAVRFNCRPEVTVVTLTT